MPKGGLPEWKKRKYDDMTEYVMASVAAGEPHAPGQHDGDGSGLYAELVYAGCENEDRALEVKRGLRNDAKRIGVSMKAWSVPNDGKVDVHYRAACKECARIWLIQTYGTDRTGWRYNPREKLKKNG